MSAGEDAARLLADLRASGELAPEVLDRWLGVIERLAALDALAGRGVVTVLTKIDGGRGGVRPYTVVVSGGILGDHFFRRDSDDLEALLDEALAHVAAHLPPA
jgi:hypothetical protein